MRDYRTPTARVRGLGASGHAAGHWIAQRVSAIALFFLVPVFVWLLATSGAPDGDAMRALLASPFGAIITLLTLSAAFFHMRLGIDEVITDYVSKTSTKTVLLIGNALLVAGLWLVTVLALLKLALNPAL